MAGDQGDSFIKQSRFSLVPTEKDRGFCMCLTTETWIVSEDSAQPHLVVTKRRFPEECHLAAHSAKYLPWGSLYTLFLEVEGKREQRRSGRG